jgi:hypothetical protein
MVFIVAYSNGATWGQMEANAPLIFFLEFYYIILELIWFYIENFTITIKRGLCEDSKQTSITRYPALILFFKYPLIGKS